MAPRKPRTLQPEERALWEKVAKQTVRLGPIHVAAPDIRQQLKKDPKPAKNRPIPHFQIGAKPSVRHVPHRVEKPSIAMDFKAYKKMKSGKLAPEARIDLHGLTLAQAHPRLIGFIQDSANRGRRLVLVITGKGRADPGDGPIPTRLGVLRHQVPHWLHSMPLKPLILQINEASRKHGGQGAIYVYLRRTKG